MFMLLSCSCCCSVYRAFTAITEERRRRRERGSGARYQFPVSDYVSRREGENMTSPAAESSPTLSDRPVLIHTAARAHIHTKRPIVANDPWELREINYYV